MTLEEVSTKYNISQNTVKTQFKRTQDNIFKKYGIKIIKEGRGSNVVYKEQIISDNRAENMFKALEPVHNTGIIKNDLNMPNFTFCVFMGIITTPMLVFRGSYNDFLRYIEVNVNDQNIQKQITPIQTTQINTNTTFTPTIAATQSTIPNEIETLDISPKNNINNQIDNNLQ